MLSDKSFKFLQTYDNDYISAGSIVDHPNALDSLRLLDLKQRSEWADILILKCKQLLNRRLNKQLKSTLSLLVQGCSQYASTQDITQAVQNNSGEVERIVTQVYSQEDQSKYMPVLRQLGFDTREQQILQYEQGIATKLWYGFKEWF